MDATIRINAKEFDESFFQKIKSFIGTNKNIEITISTVADTDKEKLKVAIDNVEKNKNLTWFTIDEFEDFKKQILNEA